ncbi:MAG: head completion/stabilization protein [Allosphingosinicella sp.]|uniref:head completion/stabilization protein n=1 Tax=Allosphingosinicella sp. TaxID=2823234 RepID=UPI00391FF5D8
MSSIVIPPPVLVAPVPAEGGEQIEFDGFFPPVDPALVRAEQRIDDNVTAGRLRAAIVAAMLTIDNDVRAWRARHQAAGHATLADVPAPVIAGESRNVLLYRRAIGCLAKAEIIERYRDFDQTGAGQRDVAELSSAIGELRRDGRHAIRDLLGKPRTMVELI